MQNTIGIDISKDRLDVFRLADRCHAQFSNDKAGHRALIRWLGSDPDLRVVFEPTGAYHRQLETALADRSLAAVKVNPRQARRFAQATGQMAKTDRVDAAMLARMGAVLQLEARPPRSAALNELRELLVARQALIKDRTAARNRRKIATQAVLKRQLDARLRQIDRQIGRNRYGRR